VSAGSVLFVTGTIGLIISSAASLDDITIAPVGLVSIVSPSTIDWNSSLNQIPYAFSASVAPINLIYSTSWNCSVSGTENYSSCASNAIPNIFGSSQEVILALLYNLSDTSWSNEVFGPFSITFFTPLDSIRDVIYGAAIVAVMLYSALGMVAVASAMEEFIAWIIRILIIISVVGILRILEIVAAFQTSEIQLPAKWDMPGFLVASVGLVLLGLIYQVVLVYGSDHYWVAAEEDIDKGRVEGGGSGLDLSNPPPYAPSMNDGTSSGREVEMSVLGEGKRVEEKKHQQHRGSLIHVRPMSIVGGAGVSFVG